MKSSIKYQLTKSMFLNATAGKNIANGKVGKVVGLDPALPFFRYNDLNGRLTETDATYVEVIHTSAGKLGYAKPIGMASFYPNGEKSLYYYTMPFHSLINKFVTD